MKISGYQKQYVYAVATFGIAGGHVMDEFVQTLNQKQMQLNGIFGVKMVENRENTEYIKKGKIAFVTPLTRYAYRKASHTKKFFVTQNCNGCKQYAIQYGHFTEKRDRYLYNEQ